MIINAFVGRWRFLSNFAPVDVELDGLTYPSVEHAYQAAKTLDRAERGPIAHAQTAGIAKRLGRRVTMRPDWDTIKRDVMLDLLRQKFAKTYMGVKLLATGNAVLIEGNTWGDTYWGVCLGEGKNHLGLLLMQVRSELRGEIR